MVKNQKKSRGRLRKHNTGGKSNHLRGNAFKGGVGYGSRTLLIALLVIALSAIALVYNLFSLPSFVSGEKSENGSSNYRLHGVDVSRYQGDIDWSLLYKQNISFAFIKATEGNSFTDVNFKQNWSRVQRTPIRFGAYHFMSFESDGVSQAKHFISTVGKSYKMLTPVIDVEFYGDFSKNPPSTDTVRSILTPLAAELEAHYGKAPIIYTNRSFYMTYISGHYSNPLWISDPEIRKPLDDNRTWDFCQYTFEGQLKGYTKHKYIDMNVFDGNSLDLFLY